VALAISLSAVIQVMLLYFLWNRRSHNTESKSVYSYYGVVMLISIPLFVLLQWFKANILAGFDTETFTGSLAVCVITGSMFLFLFGIAGYVFKVKEITDLIHRAVRKQKKHNSP